MEIFPFYGQPNQYSKWSKKKGILKFKNTL
jgi:hypothetical protein